MNAVERCARWVKYKVGLGDWSGLTCAVRPYYDFFLQAIYGRRGLARQMAENECIRIRPLHRYFRNEFEAQTFRYLRATVKEGDAILEVGANVGVFTVILARWVGSTGHVYAFEPTPKARTELRHHLRMNKVEERVTVISDAVSDSPGRSPFYVVGTSGENTLSQKHSRIPSADCIDVQVTTIDRFCRERGIAPSLIKIDIEGYEFHALRGAQEVIRRHSPRILVELHPMNWPDIGVSRETARGFISSLNCRAKSLTGEADPFSSYGHVLLEPCKQIEFARREAKGLSTEGYLKIEGGEAQRA